MLRIWLDVEDMFQYAMANPRPSGIQRVEYELCRALVERAPAGVEIRFLRHAPMRNSFYGVPWSVFAALFEGMVSQAPRSPPPPRAAEPVRQGLVFRLLKAVAYRLPTGLRLGLTPVFVHQRASLWAVRDLLRGAIRRRPPPVAPAVAAPAVAAPVAVAPPVAGDVFDREARPGDVLAVLGSPWFHPDYGALVARAQRERGLRFALLIYDLIPLRRPEFCDRGLIDLFARWVGQTLPLADIILTISRASAADVLRHAGDAAITLRTVPRPIPMGTGFSRPALPAGPRSARLPPPGSYALIVSTIEARKNHVLLFRVWRRLLDEMPRAAVPTLVFAGRVGWLVADLMQQMRNAGFLGGKIRIVEDPTDGELAQLYDGCLFTLFPSFHEGWGLPVTESLAFGRPCVVAEATSLPEAGGTLARYFDPDSASDALRVIREIIEDRPALDRWQRQVIETFKPVPWTAAADAVLAAVTAPAAG